MEQKNKNVREKIIKIDDSLAIDVKSNVFGQLIYVNRKNGETIVWERPGDIQTMSMADLRAMKANQASFFTNQWISVEDTEDENVKPADVYKALFVSQYYADAIDPTDFNLINSWTIAQIPKQIAKLTDNAKFNLITALNEYINEGKLDSVKKIKAFEEALGCELAQSN